MIKQCRSQRLCRGFTLPEVVLSLAVGSVLLGAMTSLIVISSRSIPGRGTDSSRTTSAATALEQFAADLMLATSVVSATDTLIDIKVPDRDGDGIQEEIKYLWQGTPGDPLERVVNSGSRSIVIESVAKFALSYQTVTTTTTSKSSIGSAPESVLATWTPGLLGGLLYVGYQNKSGKPLAQNFIPTLPAQTRSWRVTRVQFYAMSDLLATGTVSVQLRTTDSLGLPTGAILASTSISESSLSALAYGMNEVSFSNAPDLAPGQEVALVLECTGGSPAGSVGYTTLSVGRSEPMATYNGAAWAGSTLNVMPHIVYGTTQSTSPQSLSSKRLTQVGIQLRVGDSTGPVVNTSVNLLNAPGVQ